jgi:hypothetical protein
MVDNTFVTWTKRQLAVQHILQPPLKLIRTDENYLFCTIVLAQQMSQP